MLVDDSIVSCFFFDVMLSILFFVILGRYVLFVLVVRLTILDRPPYFRFLAYRVFLLLKRGILAGKRGCPWRETRTREGAVVVFGIHFAEYPDG